MVQDDNLISVETENHVIEVCDGCLTIGTKQYPDDCVSLTQEETEQAMKILITWKYGSGPLSEVQGE